MDFTTVIGVDSSRIRQLRLTWPTWVKNKPSLLDHQLVCFYDRDQVSSRELKFILKDHPKPKLIAWPFHTRINYNPEEMCSRNHKNKNCPCPSIGHDIIKTDKWTNPQRHKMLAGFVYVGAQVTTPYWLKLDTDVIAAENNEWVDPKWFQEGSAIIAPKWRYTKPADQMLKLDFWVKDNPCLGSYSNIIQSDPLYLIPKPGANKVCHQRICSWCAFFETNFTKLCAESAASTMGRYKLPVASQDGYQWYMAKRLGYRINTVNMKARGWVLKNGEKAIIKQLEELEKDNK